jgi:ABC-2 type transport system permease protein
MNKTYSQTRALLGILRSSLLATRRNASSLVFGLIFPLVFILIFGFLGQGPAKIDVALEPTASTDNPIYQALSHQENIQFHKDLNANEVNDRLAKGKLDGLLDIVNDGSDRPHFTVRLTTSAASPQDGGLLTVIVQGIADRTNLATANAENLIVTLDRSQVSGREYRTIDFILPGMIGFSLLNAGIFATAFVFLTLRQTLVIKRFFTTPVSRFSIIFGESLSRLIVSVIQSSILILAGYFFFHFTLINGWVTFFEMLLLAAVGLTIFLGFGLIISSVANDERTVAPIAQLVTLPQFLLAGTFFPIDALPSWLQKFANVLPLTYLNDAMRKVAFEGAGFSAIRMDLLWLVVWGVIVYAVTVRVFRWEAD